jgi:hypothetical protein
METRRDVDTSISPRNHWLALSDDQLIQQCSVDAYRASGPGGQKRNKTSSAIRLRHQSTGLIVIAEESRSQHENRTRAVRRLRRELALQVRDPWTMARTDLSLGRKDRQFWPAVALVLDALDAHCGRVKDTAGALEATTAQLVAFFRIEARLWQRANEIRRSHGQKPLY